MEPYRPTGLKLIAIYFFFIGLVGVLSALATLFIPLPNQLAGLTVAIGLLNLVLAALYILVGWGLWETREWARLAAVMLSILSVIGYLLAGVYFIGGYALAGFRLSLPGVGLGMFVLAVVPALILWYLFKPEVRDLFVSGAYAPPPLSPLPATVSAPPPRPTAPPPRPAPPIERTRRVGEPPPVTAWLVMQSGPRAGKQLGLGTGRNMIGRDGSRCDLALNDTSVSAQHAQIRFEHGQFVIHDLASTNGTFVNNRRIQRQPLMDNDVIRLGSATLVFKTVGRRRQ
jgi:hypothetical protein